MRRRSQRSVIWLTIGPTGGGVEIVGTASSGLWLAVAPETRWHSTPAELFIYYTRILRARSRFDPGANFRPSAILRGGGARWPHNFNGTQRVLGNRLRHRAEQKPFGWAMTVRAE
jgi:hypothetical protein